MCNSGIDWAQLGIVLFALGMFGLAYNALIHWLGNRKDGYVSLLVVGGVLITLLGVALIDWQAAVIGLATFSASGLPMIIGEVYRAISAREKALADQRLEIEQLARISLDDEA